MKRKLLPILSQLDIIESRALFSSLVVFLWTLAITAFSFYVQYFHR